MPDAPLLSVRDLNAWYGESHILHGVEFDVPRGEVVTLLGRNGAGKTTTLKSVMGMVARRKGSIRFEGHELSGLAPHKIINRGIGRTFQIPRPFRRLSIFENVALAGYYGQNRHSEAKANESAERALASAFSLPTRKPRLSMVAMNSAPTAPVTPAMATTGSWVTWLSVRQ